MDPFSEASLTSSPGLQRIPSDQLTEETGEQADTALCTMLKGVMGKQSRENSA